MFFNIKCIIFNVQSMFFRLNQSIFNVFNADSFFDQCFNVNSLKNQCFKPRLFQCPMYFNQINIQIKFIVLKPQAFPTSTITPKKERQIRKTFSATS